MAVAGDLKPETTNKPMNTMTLGSLYLRGVYGWSKDKVQVGCHPLPLSVLP